MKLFIATLSLTFLGTLSAHAATSCLTQVEAAAHQAALEYHDGSIIGASDTGLVSQEIRNGRTVRVYDVFTETCSAADESSCGSLSYKVIALVDATDCKVVRIELTGEE